MEKKNVPNKRKKKGEREQGRCWDTAEDLGGSQGTSAWSHNIGAGAKTIRGKEKRNRKKVRKNSETKGGGKRTQKESQAGAFNSWN